MADATSDSIVYLPRLVDSLSDLLPNEHAAADNGTAARVLADLARTCPPGWTAYQIGKVAAGEARWREALDCFDEARRQGLQNSRIHLAKAIVLRNLGDDPAAVSAEIKLFVESAPDNLTDDEKREIEQAADASFNAALYDDSFVFYRRLVAENWGGYLCKLRLADIEYRRKNTEQALRLLDELGDDPAYGIWAISVRAAALIDLNETASAIIILKELIERVPSEAAFVRQLFEAFARSGHAAELATFERYLSGIDERQRVEFSMRSAFVRKDYSEIASLHARCAPFATPQTDEVVCRTLAVLTRLRDFDALREFTGQVSQVESNGTLIDCAILGALFTTDDYDAAEKILNKHPGSDDPNILVRRLEFCCWTLRLDEAGALLAKSGGYRGVPSAALPVVTNYYAALGQWDLVFSVFSERIVKEPWSLFPAIVLPTVTRAMRETGRRAELLELLDEAIATREPIEALVNFRNQVAEEIALMRILAGGSEAVPDINDEFRAQRMDLYAKILRPDAEIAAPKHIFLCTDAAYLLGTCVAISSLLRNNPNALLNCTLSVFCTDDVCDFAKLVLKKVAARTAARINVFSSGALIGDGVRLRTAYGHFGPGHSLPEAVYHRIFVVDRMLREGATGRLLYLDADTVIDWGIERLLALDMQGFPLAAHLEDPTIPSVNRAAHKLGIEPGTYFNSGVLLFDLSHRDIAARIEAAIDAAVNTQDKLTFQDQCALNLAFNGKFLELPDEFNCFVRLTTPLDKLGQAKGVPVVWHFLDRPKPWDPQYGTTNCSKWLREFAALRSALSPRELRQLMALQLALDASIPEPGNELEPAQALYSVSR